VDAATRPNAPAARGALLALASAVLFGVTTPLVQRFGVGVDSFVTAALLYAGAALAGWLTRRPIEREARLLSADLPRILLAAFCGAAIGPVALAWGLQHASATPASLMLTLEAVFTAWLARLFYGESMGARVAIAMLIITAGAAVLVVDAGSGTLRSEVLGLLAVLCATAAWAADNTISRPLAQRDPGRIVLAKAAIGACATSLIALVSGAVFPSVSSAFGLFFVGAIGYGLSLRLYLLAQRAFGAGRTASVFAFAPFIGALVAVALRERGASVWLVAAAALMLFGVFLHLRERHSHTHAHDTLEHEHAHTHDDGHHTHEHDPMPAGAHSHWHRHSSLTHAHPHVPDAHHTHRH
jgi:drug/metabolite transporter (DMT)-like permease